MTSADKKLEFWVNSLRTLALAGIIGMTTWIVNKIDNTQESINNLEATVAVLQTSFNHFAEIEHIKVTNNEKAIMLNSDRIVNLASRMRDVEQTLPRFRSRDGK